MLYAQGFGTAEELSGKVVMLFGLCEDQLSSQSHYDFGLRALKSVLRSAGQLKRAEINDSGHSGESKGDHKGGEEKNWVELEQEILVRSMCDTVVPKLVNDDVPLFNTLIKAVFPKANVAAPMVKQLRAAIAEVAKSKHFVDDQSWIDKIMQLDQLQTIAHGVITVGPSGSGKSSARQTLRAAMEQVDGVKIDEYIIDPKAMSKDDLYGTMDPTTLEWTNGVFTYIIRKIIDNVRGEQTRRHWIVFDGDVDPEWAENLNSVLDDNKLLTLPNGERLALTPNIRIMFEVQNLNHATPATVSR
jgi:dynein heavy chain 1